MKKYPVWLKANVPEELRKRYEAAAAEMEVPLETYVRIALNRYAQEHLL